MWSFDTPADFRRKLDWVKNFVASDVVQLDLLHGHASDRRTPETVELFHSLRQRVRAAHLWAPHLERTLGGCALPYVELALLDEAIGTSRWAPAVFGYTPHQSLCARVLSTYADPVTRGRFLPKLLEGDCVAAYALNEPYVGGTKSMLRTTGTLENGGWLLRGEKWFIDNAAFAEFFLVIARTHPSLPDREAFTLFLVPAGTDGVDLIGVTSIGGEDLRHSNHGHIELRDVRLPQSAVMGTVGGAYDVVRTCRSPLELHEQGRAAGVMRRCLEMMCEHAANHETKRGPLAKFQATMMAVGKTRYDVEQFRLMLLRAAWEADTAGAEAATETVMAVKAALPSIMGRVVQRAAHLHGALGVSSDMPFASWRAWADALGVSDGATESYWTDLGHLMISAAPRRPRQSWPAEHIPTATKIIAESARAMKDWTWSPTDGL